MDFKKNTERHITVYYGDDEYNLNMPEPEVGKIYHGFDDGKIRLSRLIDWKIIKRIDLDHDIIEPELLDMLQEEIHDCSWVFDPHQTIIFYAKAVDDNGNYYEDIGDCYFIRTLNGGWFGAGANMFMWCELDVDNRWYNELIKEQQKLNKRKK